MKNQPNLADRAHGQPQSTVDTVSTNSPSTPRQKGQPPPVFVQSQAIVPLNIITRIQKLHGSARTIGEVRVDRPEKEKRPQATPKIRQKARALLSPPDLSLECKLRPRSTKLDSLLPEDVDPGCYWNGAATLSVRSTNVSGSTAGVSQSSALPRGQSEGLHPWQKRHSPSTLVLRSE